MLFMIFVYVFKEKMNNDEKIEECNISFHTYLSYFFKEEVNRELKKSDVKRKDNTGFMILFCTEPINDFSHITFIIFVV